MTTNSTPQFSIGIDLGTTHCVMSFVEMAEESPRAELFAITQVIADGTTEERENLPSFLYLAPDFEAEKGGFKLPWQSGDENAVAGEFSRTKSAEVPDRTVVAAKSWLCYSQVDRHAGILPWTAPDEVERVSPVTASRHFLQHLRQAWDHSYPDSPLADQQVTLTVPASFDAAARDLTREAALTAGLPASLVLLEEPQAAFYAWLETEGDHWRKKLAVGDRVLVCDVGGGTTDLTLIRVAEQGGDLELVRESVGRHLLVGGDNMDLALAYDASQRFKEQGVDLDPWQSVSLWHSCRLAKEVLLKPKPPKSHKITVKKRGSKLVGGTVSVELDAQETRDRLLEGFFPHCSLTDQPQKPMATGFQELGLPYESDTAITRHVADFLNRQGGDANDSPLPTHLLFNGGVFKSSALKERLLSTIGSWSGDASPVELSGDRDLDYSVARGAAYYGWVKRQGGMRIRGGTARSYYIGIESAGLAIPGAPRPLRALCVVPFGMEEGTEADVPSAEIGLVLDQPVRFRFFSSVDRHQDETGKLLDRWSPDELEESSALETTLTSSGDSDDSFVPVRFRSVINELGVLELWCKSAKSEAQWKLEFDVRDEQS